MPDKFRSARRGYNLIRGARYVICELSSQKNRCLANSKISRPLFGFIYAAHKRRIFLGRKVGVESGTKLRIHNDGSDKRLLAVRLLNHAIDMQWAKNSCCALIIIDDNSITPGRNMGVIRCWN